MFIDDINIIKPKNRKVIIRIKIELTITFDIINIGPIRTN